MSDVMEVLAREAGIRVDRGMMWSGEPWLDGLLFATPYGPELRDPMRITWQQIERFGELVARAVQSQEPER